MAVKRKGSGVKSVLNEYVQDFLSFLLSSLEGGAGGLIKKLIDFMNFKKRLRRDIITLMIVIASLATIFWGVGELLGSFFPSWRPGMAHITIGIILLLIALAYRKFD